MSHEFYPPYQAPLNLVTRASFLVRHPQLLKSASVTNLRCRLRNGHQSDFVFGEAVRLAVALTEIGSIARLPLV